MGRSPKDNWLIPRAFYCSWLITFAIFYFRNLGRKIGRIIALALDLDVDFFDKPEILGNAMPYVSFNHYGGYVSDHP